MNNDAFQRLTELVENQSRPPVHLWEPKHSGEIDIRIDRSGAWFHDGTRIARQPLVDLFATILRRDGDAYFLVTPQEKLRIEVEDVPFIVVDFEASGHDDELQIACITNVGDAVLIDADHPLLMREGVPYVLIRGGLEARMDRSVFYRLVELGWEEGGEWRLSSRGATFSLGAVA